MLGEILEINMKVREEVSAAWLHFFSSYKVGTIEMENHKEIKSVCGPVPITVPCSGSLFLSFYSCLLFISSKVLPNKSLQ